MPLYNYTSVLLTSSLSASFENANADICYSLDRYILPVIATADNCLLTCYNFLALHQSDYHVVCEELTKKASIPTSVRTEKISYGEALLVPCVSAIRPPTENSQITTSTSFGLSSSAYSESSEPSTGSTSANQKGRGELSINVIMS